MLKFKFEQKRCARQYLAVIFGVYFAKLAKRRRSRSFYKKRARDGAQKIRRGIFRFALRLTLVTLCLQ